MMSARAVIGYEAVTATPVELTDCDIEGWVHVESNDETLLCLMARYFTSKSALILDFSGRLSGRAPGFKKMQGGEASQYAFCCKGDAGRFSELLARGLVSALNLNEEEHIALTGAARTYYSNAEAGGVISISSMLPEKSRQLDLLKSKLEELTVIPPTFGTGEQAPDRVEVDLKEVDGRYARRALAYVITTKYASDHPGATVMVGSFDEMLPETQTKSMRYPLEVATSLLWDLRSSGLRLIAQSRRPLPKELDGFFGTRILESEGCVRMKRSGSEWKEVYLINGCEWKSEAEEPDRETVSTEDEEATRLVITTVDTYANVSYAGLVSFLKGRMEEKRVQRTTDRLIRDGYLAFRGGGGGAQCLTLTEAGKSLKSSLEAGRD
jgi:hypothetical protein